MELSKIKEGDFSFVYLSREECSVCHVLLPKVEDLATKYPESTMTAIDLNNTPEAAGEFMVFSIPALIVYSRGKELYRGARFFNFGELEDKLDRYYSAIFNK